MPPWPPYSAENAWKLQIMIQNQSRSERSRLCYRTRVGVKGAYQTKRCVLGYWLEVGAHCKNKKSILVENKVRNREDVI